MIVNSPRNLLDVPLYQITIILIAFVFSSKVEGQQNLVINGGFETHNAPSGPYFWGSITNAPPWQNVLSADLLVVGNGGNPPYFANPRTGEAHAGIVGSASNGNTLYKEYIIGQTQSLTAGQQYRIEFWATKREDATHAMNYGAYLSPTYTTNLYQNPLVNPQIQGVVSATNTEYIQILGFWTPTQNGQHFIHIGSFEPTGVEGTYSVYASVDDVSITACDGGGSPPNLSFTVQDAYCQYPTSIVANADASTNVDSYRWQLHSSNGNFIGGTEWSDAELAEFELMDVFYSSYFPPGECFTLTLEAVNDGDCNTHEYSQEFCIEDPNIDFIFDGNPVCGNEPFDLEVTGDNNWLYSWSTGDEGVGMKSITVTPLPGGSNSYYVNVTTSAGCTGGANVDLTVHNNPNATPYITGINGSGENMAYIQSGQNICFDLFSVDSPNESVSMDYDFEIINGIWSPITQNQEGGTFCWQTTLGDIGLHEFTVTVTDNNACDERSETYTIKIKVVCAYCPIDVYYQNRTPSGIALPSYTIAGRSITAGENVDPGQPIGPVETGDAEVVFKAPEINLLVGFDAGPNFDAIIDEQTCIDDCEECCEFWEGFTHDGIPNVFTPNGDGVNDYWYVPDASNPFCAFNAKTYSLVIINGWGDYVRNVSYNNPLSTCCPFKAPGPNNNIPHSAIFWDGTVQGSGLMASDGVYNYILTLGGCGQFQSFTGQIYLLDGGRSLASDFVQLTSREVIVNYDRNEDFFPDILPDSALIGVNKKVEFDMTGDIDNFYDSISESAILQGDIANPFLELSAEQDFMVYPNPSNDYFWVESNLTNYEIRVFNSSGQIVYSKSSMTQLHKIDLSSHSNGVYLIQILSNSSLFTKYVVKL